MSVCSDASPIIHLSRVDLLRVLPELFRRVLVPSAVFDEVVTAGLERPGSTELPAAAWAEIVETEKSGVPGSVELDSLGAGEAAAILLALDRKCDLVLLDDAHARLTARHLGLRVRGTLGVLVEAKRRGLIETVAPLLHELRSGGMWMSKALIQAILESAEES